MKFEPSRLRRGEVIVSAGAIVLLALMFVTPWYGLSGAAQQSTQALGHSTTLNAWHALTTLRWLMLTTILCALALAYFQGAREAPALPTSLGVFALVLGAITSLLIIYRLINPPGDLWHVRVGAFLGLAASLVMTYGAYRSLREETPRDPVRSAAIPTVRVGP
jgi:hypothetical protein